MARLKKYLMLKDGRANINNRQFEWKAGEMVGLYPVEVVILKRGGYTNG